MTNDTDVIKEAAERITQQAETIANLQFHNRSLQAELNSVNKYKDKLTAAVLVLLDQCKSGEVSIGAIYDVDILLGE